MTELIFPLLLEAPLEAMMASKVKCWIKTALVSLLVLSIDAVLVLAAVEAKSVLMWLRG